MSQENAYLLGHADQEMERLKLQAACLEGLTRRLIRECGIEAGMVVADFGSGAGDVAMLVAEAVGEGGKVIGVEAEPRAVAMARARAQAAGLSQVTFEVGSDSDLARLGPFDAVISRCVLVHQPDPSATLRRLAAAVRRGGVVACMEPAVHVDTITLPEVELIRAFSDSMSKFMRVALPSPDIAGRIIPCFIDAGLPTPKVLWEAIVPTLDLRLLQLGVLTYQTFLPLMQRFGTVDQRVGDPATLYDRLLDAAVAARAQSVLTPYVSAWARRDEPGPTPFASAREA
jgi:SAM-dependent methyltransferase